MSGRPLVGAAVAFAAGVGLGAWLPQRPVVLTAAAAALLAGWVVLLGLRRHSVPTLLGPAVVLVAGAAFSQVDLIEVYREDAEGAEGDAVLRGRVLAPPQRRGSATTVRLGEARLRVAEGTFAPALPVEVFVEEAAAEFLIGEKLTVRGRAAELRANRNLGWFPRPARPRGERVGLRVFAASPLWVRREGREAAGGADAAVLRWREAASRFWSAAPGPASAILDALTTGERSAIPAAVQEAFLRAGLTHILAISGMNVAFLAALVYLALRRLLGCVEPLALRRPVQPIAAVATLPFLWFFFRFSGSQIPVGRATVTMAAAMLAVVLWRRIDPLDGCALAALTVLAADPRALFSASFELSFAAVAALALVAPRLVAPAEEREFEPRWGTRLRRGARGILLASLAAGAATAPLVAFHFHQVNLVGPLANLVAVPLSGLLVLPAAWLALAAAAVWPAAGEALRAAAALPADALIGVAEFFAAPSWSSLPTPRPPLLLLLALLGLVAAILAPGGGRTLRRARLGAAAAAVAALIAWRGAASAGGLRAAFLDVGQGLAVVVFPPGGGVLLADTGPRWRDDDAGRRIVTPALRRLGVARIDTLALTHAHPDHAGGAASVLREFPVRRLWIPEDGPGFEEGELGAALRARGRNGRPAEELARGDTRPLGGQSRAIVLGPPGAMPGARAAVDANARSLLLLLDWRSGSMLLTGDAGPAEAAAVRPGLPPRRGSLILQVPHHGASAEACRSFASDWRPGLSVVAVGRNSYGHPRGDAVAALAQQAPVLRTDRDGAVLVFDGPEGPLARSWRELARGRTWGERLRWAAAGW